MFTACLELCRVLGLLPGLVPHCNNPSLQSLLASGFQLSKDQDHPRSSSWQVAVSP